MLQVRSDRRVATCIPLALGSAPRKLGFDAIEGLDELARDYLGDRDRIDTITCEELARRLDRGDVVVVDVRPAAEYATGHLPGAIHRPDQLDRLDDLPDDRDVVAYCRGPYCVYADDAVRHLRRRGQRALRLEDGLPEWRHAGGQLEPA